MVAPLVRTSVRAKPGKSFAATSFDAFGGSSGKVTGFMPTVYNAVLQVTESIWDRVQRVGARYRPPQSKYW